MVITYEREKNWTIEISQERKVQTPLHPTGVLCTGLSLGWGVVRLKHNLDHTQHLASAGAETFGSVTPASPAARGGQVPHR